MSRLDELRRANFERSIAFRYRAFDMRVSPPVAFRAPEPLNDAERAELDELHRHGRKDVIGFRRKSWLRLRGAR